MAPHVAAAIALTMVLAMAGAQAQESTGLSLRGSVAAVGALFPQNARMEVQPDHKAGWSTLRLNASATLSPGTDLVFSGRTTLAVQTDDTLYADVGELFIERRAGAFLLRAGVLDERWGALDAANPTNIVNQLDLVEDYEGDQRLGQPGVGLRWLGDDLTLSLFGLLWNRERRLAEGADRLRPTDLPFGDANFENGKFAPSFAARAFVSNGGFEAGLSHFHGTSREPEFDIEADLDGVRLIPSYRRIDQTALDAQMVVGDYVLRGEAFHRWGQSGRAFFGIGVGAERILYGVVGGASDVQFYAEAYFDDRPRSAPVTAFDNDLSLGGRWFFNDADNTELTLRATTDLIKGSVLIEIGARRRVLDDVMLGLNVTVPLGVEDDRALGGFRDDARILISLARFF